MAASAGCRSSRCKGCPWAQASRICVVAQGFLDLEATRVRGAVPRLHVAPSTKPFARARSRSCEREHAAVHASASTQPFMRARARSRSCEREHAAVHARTSTQPLHMRSKPFRRVRRSGIGGRTRGTAGAGGVAGDGRRSPQNQGSLDGFSGRLGGEPGAISAASLFGRAAALRFARRLRSRSCSCSSS